MKVLVYAVDSSSEHARMVRGAIRGFGAAAMARDIGGWGGEPDFESDADAVVVEPNEQHDAKVQHIVETYMRRAPLVARLGKAPGADIKVIPTPDPGSDLFSWAREHFGPKVPADVQAPSIDQVQPNALLVKGGEKDPVGETPTGGSVPAVTPGTPNPPKTEGDGPVIPATLKATTKKGA